MFVLSRPEEALAFQWAYEEGIITEEEYKKRMRELGFDV